VKVQGERRFEAPRETVWNVLQDPAQMAQLMPGVESFDVEDDRRWTANMKIPLGLGSLRMSINFEKTEERKPEFSRLHAKGTGVGALMNLETEFNLTEQGEATAMAWEADVRIAGPVGSMGQRVLQPIVNQQVQHVLTALDAQIAKAAGGATTPPQHSESGGLAGGSEPSLDASTGTDPETKDYGPPAETTPEGDPAVDAGSSGAEEGLSPLEEESYSSER
jgi:carbon monoxide dehydrogenase subunit G